MAQGLPVIAVMDGVVLRSDNSNPKGYGNVVDIRYPDGTVHRMAHLASRAVAVGDRIPAGSVLGVMGNTGNASGGGVHLHYEVIDGDYYAQAGGRPPGRGTEGRLDPSEWWYNNAPLYDLPVAGSSYGGWGDVPRSGGAPNSRWFGGPRAGGSQEHAGIDIYFKGEQWPEDIPQDVFAYAEDRGFLPDSVQATNAMARGEPYIPTLHVGMGTPDNPSPNVRELQRFLNEEASANLETDGIFGDRTRQAIMAFQSRNGFSGDQIDGVVGPQTYGAIAQTSTRDATAWNKVRDALPFQGRVLDFVADAMGFSIPGNQNAPRQNPVRSMWENQQAGRTEGQSPEQILNEAATRRVVRNGETLWDIAQREYGDPSMWRMIAEANPGLNPQRLRPGQQIALPPVAGSGASNRPPTPVMPPAQDMGRPSLIKQVSFDQRAMGAAVGPQMAQVGSFDQRANDALTAGQRYLDFDPAAGRLPAGTQVGPPNPGGAKAVIGPIFNALFGGGGQPSAPPPPPSLQQQQADLYGREMNGVPLPTGYQAPLPTPMSLRAATPPWVQPPNYAVNPAGLPPAVPRPVVPMRRP